MSVDELSGVLLYVDAEDADLAAVRELDITVLTERLVVLRYLVGLWEVGIAVVLSVHLGYLGYFTVSGEAGHYRVSDHLSVELRKRTGKPDTYRTAVSVRLAAEGRGTGAENLGVG